MRCLCYFRGPVGRARRVGSRREVAIVQSQRSPFWPGRSQRPTLLHLPLRMLFETFQLSPCYFYRSGVFFVVGESEHLGFGESDHFGIPKINDK